MQKKNTKIKNVLVYIILLFSLFIACPGSTKAASFYLSPSSGTYNIGEKFTVNVYVSSAEQAMNAASGIVSFSPDKLEVVSISKSGTIFSLWVQEPAFSNSTGKINFEGVVLNPGFKGSSGKIMSILFKSKISGGALLSFSSVSILANDGNGTNILTGTGSATFSIGSQKSEVKEPETPTKVSGVPSAPQITSSTHPDSDKWYALKDAKFNWSVSKDITGASLLVGTTENVTPTVTYNIAISSKEVKDLDDGVWYFHVRLKNAKGWGATSHFKFQIDTTKPESFDIKQVDDKLSSTKAKFTFTAKDISSGIDHYEIQIDNSAVETWKDSGNNTYETPLLNPGKHTLLVKAVDAAGNFLEKSTEFTVEGLEPPTIIEYSKELQSGEILTIKGTTYPSSDVIIWIQKGRAKPKNYNIISSENGEFILSIDKLSRGNYTIWAEVINKNGLKSNPSQKINILVKSGAIFSWIINLPILLIPLIILILLVSYFCYKCITFKRKVRAEVYGAKTVLHKSFEFLKKDIQYEIKSLTKIKNTKQLLEQAERMSKQFKRDLDNAEKGIKREIDDIEKEVK